MLNENEKITVSNPRLLSAAFFAPLAIIITIAIDTALPLLQMDFMLPLYQSIVLAVVVAASFGALFGRAIVYSPNSKWAFWWAFFMVLCAVPVYNLGYLALLKHQNPILFQDTTVQRQIFLYFYALGYSYSLAGIWMAILAGFAGVYLRGYLVNYLLKALYVKRQTPRDKVTKNKII